jgi:Tol biopolymer transport system component
MSYTRRFITSVLVAVVASLALTVCLALAHTTDANPDAHDATLGLVVAAKDERAPVPATTPIIGLARLVFTSDRDGNTEIYTQAGDNSPQVNLTNNPATDACPALSPDGTKIAFTSNRGGRTRIYVMEVDGGNVRAVAQFGDANSTARVYDPAWSPDGTKLVFVVNFNPGQISTLVIVPADGSNDQRLLGVGYDAADPAWSPDGTRIAFIARGDLFNGERGELFYLFVINTDNSRPSDPVHGVTRVASEPLAFNSLTYPPDGSGPTWSPDGTRLAFTSDRDGNPEIYTVSATGGAVQRLTNNPAADTLPTWFGQGIAFTSTRNGARDVYVMYPGGLLISGEPLMFRITGNAGSNFDADWGPITPAATPAVSASRIAFVRVNRTNPDDADIYTANPDGTNEVNVTNSPEREHPPAWSPDGKMIAFVRRDFDHSLMVMNADGTNVRRLTSVSSNYFRPAWSPDGRRLAFIGGSDLAYTISVVNVDGTGHRRLVPLDATYSEVAWSPDGTRIAYVLDRASAFFDPAIHVVNLDGTGHRILSTGDNRDRHPAWSPDGSKIAFTGIRTNPEIYVMNADGTNQRQLTNNTVTDVWPTWSPDGQTIIFSNDRDGGTSELTGDFELYRMNAADGSNVQRITNNDVHELAPNWNQGERSTIQWRNASFRINERQSGIPGGNVDQLVVTRLGDLSHPATVEYATDDSCRDALGEPQAICTALASHRSDYVSARGTIRFAMGEDSKTIFITTIDDAKVEGDERLNIVLSNPTGASLGEQRIVPVVITDNDTNADAPNPIDDARFFVRMHYLDFLGREPELTGLEAWVGVWTRCPNIFNDTTCDRVTISSSFFRSREFYVKGYLIYRFYRAALGRRPTYAEFVRDLPLLFAQTGAELEARQNDYNIAWLHREEFSQVANTFTHEQFVNHLIENIGITLTGTVTRETLLADLNAGRRTRAGVLRAIVEHPNVEHAEYNGAFVTMQYFGYLKRDPDADGFADWLDYLNAHPADFRTMVHGFVASNEYRSRFGKP